MNDPVAYNSHHHYSDICYIITNTAYSLLSEILFVNFTIGQNKKQKKQNIKSETEVRIINVS